MGVFPRAKLIIRDETTPNVEYVNVSLLNKSSYAVAQALKRYLVPIEKFVLINNGIKQQETKLMIECLNKHYNKVQILVISKNKIGF
jgi:hypothetical protein